MMMTWSISPRQTVREVLKAPNGKELTQASAGAPLPTPDSAPALQISTPLAAPPVTTPSPWSEECWMVADVDDIYGPFGMTALRAMHTTEDECQSVLGRVPPLSLTLSLRNMSTRSNNPKIIGDGQFSPPKTPRQ